MTSLDMVSSVPHVFKVQACATLGNGDLKCVESNDIQLTVRDPCLITSIDADDIDRVLEGSVNSSDEYIMASWMFTDSVDQDKSGYPGDNKCGLVKGEVRDASGNPVDFCYFDNTLGKIVLNPGIDTIPDSYNLYVHYFMEDYPTRFVNKQFVAVVNAC